MIPYAEDYKKNQDNGPPSSYFENEKQVKWYHYVLLNRPSKVIVTLLLVAILTPVLLYAYILTASLDQAPSDGYSQGSCILPRESRLPCGRGYIPQSECHPQCCYDLVNNMCFHRLPSRFSYIMDREWSEGLNLQPRVATEPFADQPSLTNIRLSIDEVTRRHLSITFYNSREVIPEARKLDEKDYEYTISSPELNVEVTAGDIPIFNTRRGPLIAAEDIWETSFQLTNESMYGFGEIPLSSSSKIIYNHRGGLASIPLIFAQVNGTFHGLLIDVETPTEIFIDGNNQIVVRSITSTQLKFHLFLGPDPKDVMENVMNFIGFEQSRLEYWMLGAHVCSEITDLTKESYEKLVEFTTEAISSNLPYESHCGTAPLVMNQGCDDEDYLENIELGSVLVQNDGRRHVPHLAPYIRYIDPNLEEHQNSSSNCSVEEFVNLFVTTNGSLYRGLAGVEIVYPNYGNSSTRKLIELFWHFNNGYSGLFLENGWPLDESDNWNNETHLHLPYFNNEFTAAFQETPQWNATIDNVPYLYQHNNYGENFYRAMKEFSGNDKPVWTSTQRLNGQAFINRQSVETTWSSLRRQLVEAALGGISGHWFWTSPICGDTDSFDPNTQTNLCAKWYMAGTYFPMVNIYSKGERRDPLAFTGTNRQYMIEALYARQRLLPYFYTVLQKGPLLRPMFYQFPKSRQLQDISTQFSVGDHLVIVPNLLPSQSLVNIWLPPGSWFEMWSGLKLGDDEELVSLTTTDADFVTLIRGGSIVVLQKEIKTTAEETRQTSNYSAIIALDCDQVDEASTCASGELFISKNLTIHFNATSERLTIAYEGDDLGSLCGAEAISASTIKDITIYGLDESHNNFDHYRQVEATTNLCELQATEQIVYLFL